MKNHTVTLPREELEILELKAEFADTVASAKPEFIKYSNSTLAVIKLNKEVLLEHIQQLYPEVTHVKVELV